jgi:hypothetical protein
VFQPETWKREDNIAKGSTLQPDGNPAGLGYHALFDPGIAPCCCPQIEANIVWGKSWEWAAVIMMVQQKPCKVSGVAESRVSPHLSVISIHAKSFRNLVNGSGRTRRSARTSLRT